MVSGNAKIGVPVVSMWRTKNEGLSALTGVSGVGTPNLASFAASFNGNTANYLSRASGTEFDHGGKFTIAAWAKVPDVSGVKVIAGRWQNSAANRDWFIKIDNNDFQALVYGAGGVAFSTGEIANTVVANTWYFLCLTFDDQLGASNEMTMFKTDENNSATETDFTQRLTNNGGGGAAFGIGRVDGGATAFNGEIGPVLYWHDLRINVSQFNWLANSGNGRGFLEIDSSADVNNPGSTNLMYWGFHEASGSTRKDCGAGARTLTVNGSVPRTAGHVSEETC